MLLTVKPCQKGYILLLQSKERIKLLTISPFLENESTFLKYSSPGAVLNQQWVGQEMTGRGFGPHNMPGQSFLLLFSIFELCHH